MHNHFISEQEFLDRLNKIIEDNLENEHYGVSELARDMGMSRSNLHRKLKSVANITVSQLIRKTRLKRALKKLRESSMTISDVAVECGFNSLTYFTKCFKNYYGVPPSKFSMIEETDTFPDISRNLPEKKVSKINKTAYIWILAIFIITVVVVFIILRPNLFLSNRIVNEKSIAVLPCSYNNTDEDNTFLVDGLMNEIRYKLEMLEDLTVVSRPSVERYRDTGKTIKEIGAELNVNYILEGKISSKQGKIIIELQLYDAEGVKPLWSEPMEKEIVLEQIFEVQKEVVLTVSKDLKALSTQMETEKLDRVPTDNPAAFNLFMLGTYYMNISIYSPDRKSSNQAIFKAKELFEQAIKLDSTFSDANSSLGSIYINNLYYLDGYWNLDKANDDLEIGLGFLEKALSYDEENLEALRAKAAYFDKKDQHENANDIWKRLSKHEEPSYEYYQNEVMRYYNLQDYYLAIESYQKYLQLKPEKSVQPPHLLKTLINIFKQTGYYELEKLLVDQLLDFTRDSLGYLRNRVSSEIYLADFEAALNYANEASSLDSTNSYSHWLIALCYAWLNDFPNALHHLVTSEDLVEKSGAPVKPGFISGYIYHMNGYETQADYHFTGAIERRQKEIENKTPTAQHFYSHFYLACTYLALGDEKRALEYIKDLKPPGIIDYAYIKILTNWSGLENIRKKPEYLKVLENFNNKYKEQHKRIGKLTEDLELKYLQNRSVNSNL